MAKNIVENIKKERTKYDEKLLPNDYMIISPFIKKNLFLKLLEHYI